MTLSQLGLDFTVPFMYQRSSKSLSHLTCNKIELTKFMGILSPYYCYVLQTTTEKYSNIERKTQYTIKTEAHSIISLSAIHSCNQKTSQYI
jgi:hypothetical protein